MRTTDILSLFQQPPKTISKDGAHYGTPYRHGETPLGENLAHGEVPTSIRKSFRRHPDIEALSLLPDIDSYNRLNNDIAIHGIQVPIILWRTTRTTSDERVITEYIVVDGYLRLRLAEDLKVPLESIPWIVNEDIQSLEDALNVATRLKIHRSHYNECERKYMIGLRYLQEKNRVGAPEGSQNALKHEPEESDLDEVQNESKNNGANLAPLNSSDSTKPVRVSERVAQELQMGRRSIMRYAKTAQNIEIVVDEIVERWKVSRANAVRCCTQLYLEKYDKNGVPVDTRQVTAGDWARIDVAPGCLDAFPLKVKTSNVYTGKELDSNALSHYHDEREAAIIEAVRTIVTPPRMKKDYVDYVDVSYTVTPSTPQAQIEQDYIAREAKFLRMTVDLSPEECQQDPEWVAWDKAKKERLIVVLEKAALTDPNKEERLHALRSLARMNHPLPTDELDEKEMEIIRRSRDIQDNPSQESALTLLREAVPLDADWSHYSETAQHWSRTFRQFRDVLKNLEDATDAMVTESRMLRDKYDREEIEGLSTWQGPEAVRLKEVFLEIAKVLVDTTANHPYLVVNRDSSIQNRIKQMVIEAFDNFEIAAADTAGEIRISTRYVTHRNTRSTDAHS